jgi:hypothetical protein
VPTHRRLTVGPARLALVAAAALLVLTALPPVAPAADAYGWRHLPPPKGDYSPRHVRQSLDNCVFAAGAMLLDKWSHGRIRVTQGRLRKASGDKDGGSSLRYLARAYARTVGLRLRTPGFGGDMSWWELLDRLESGGGAVVVGEYNRLPDNYSHWNRRYANRRRSSHALYVERYDRANGRVWVKDPLAPGGWPGEWYPVEVLRRFADFDGRRVVAAATPARRRPTAPLIDQAYRVGAPRLSAVALADHPLPVSVPFRSTAGFPRPDAQRLVATWRPSDDPTGEPVAITRSGFAKPGEATIDASLPVPPETGRYIVELRAETAAGKGTARPLGTVAVRVVGPYSGALTIDAPASVRPRERFEVRVGVTNVGTVDWRTPGSGDAGVAAEDVSAVLTLVWRRGDETQVAAASAELALAPGRRIRAELLVRAPTVEGPWQLDAYVSHPILGPMLDMDDALSAPTVVVGTGGGSGAGTGAAAG